MSNAARSPLVVSADQQVVPRNEMAAVEVTFRKERRCMPPELISAAIIAHLKAAAEGTSRSSCIHIDDCFS